MSASVRYLSQAVSYGLLELNLEVVFSIPFAWAVVRKVGVTEFGPQRGYVDLNLSEMDHIHYSGLYPVLGWFLHYLPFVIMSRVTYVHHYYPALYFAILSFGFLTDWLLRNRIKQVQIVMYGMFYTLIVGLYIFFIPICWGMTGSNKQYSRMKWFDSWRVSDPLK